MLTMERAKQLLATTTTEEHLLLHAKNVSYAMGGIARHLGEDDAHWEAIGYLHDYDYEQHPQEHLQHTEQPLLEAGLTAEEVRGILAHGYGHVNDVEPVTLMEKALFTGNSELAAEHIFPIVLYCIIFTALAVFCFLRQMKNQ